MLTTLILAGPLPVASLAEQLGIDRTTLTRNVALGEKAGLVKTAAGKDRRIRLVAITPAGRELADKALPAWREAQQKFAAA
jgi:DNA-binding MarR family transcriptional regulator